MTRRAISARPCVQVCDAAQKAAGKNGCDYNFTIPGRDVDDPGRACHLSLTTSWDTD